MTEPYFGPKLCDCDGDPILSTNSIYVEEKVDGELKKLDGQIFIDWCPTCNHFEVTADN